MDYALLLVSKIPPAHGVALLLILTKLFPYSLLAKFLLCESRDSYLELYGPDGSFRAFNDDGAGYPNSWLVYRFPSSGTYRLVARSWNYASSGGYTLQVSLNRGSSAALSALPLAASFDADGNAPANATDGDLSTSWVTSSNLNQWFYMDFGETRDISQAVLQWNDARASAYTLFWYDGNWQPITAVTGGRGNIDVLNFDPVSTRYLGLVLTNRDAQWNNYSLAEIRAYYPQGVLIPLVPPDDPEKPAETGVPPLIPLAPFPDGKESPILALATDIDTVPLTDINAAAAFPGISLNDVFGNPVTGLSIPTHTVLPGQVVTASAVNPHDVDTNQAGNGITGYRWTLRPLVIGDSGGTIDELSTQPTVNIPTTYPAGRYLLALEVKDDEGNWSDPVTTVIIIGYERFLPALVK
jgi:hypothetical protein